MSDGEFYSYTSDGSLPKKIRWWERFTDRKVRETHRIVQEVKSGDVTMVTVATLPNGVEVQVPAQILPEWEAMPDHAKADFLAAITEHANERRMHDDPS